LGTNQKTAFLNVSDQLCSSEKSESYHGSQENPSLS
jgi:hypothetical protein